MQLPDRRWVLPSEQRSVAGDVAGKRPCTCDLILLLVTIATATLDMSTAPNVGTD